MAISRLARTQSTRSQGKSAQAHARSLTRNAGMTPHRERTERERAHEKGREVRAEGHAASSAHTGDEHSSRGRDDGDHGAQGTLPEWAREHPPRFWHAADTEERAKGRRANARQVDVPRDCPRTNGVSAPVHVSRNSTVRGLRLPWCFPTHTPLMGACSRTSLCCFRHVNWRGWSGARLTFSRGPMHRGRALHVMRTCRSRALVDPIHM